LRQNGVVSSKSGCQVEQAHVGRVAKNDRIEKLRWCSIDDSLKLKITNSIMTGFRILHLTILSKMAWLLSFSFRLFSNLLVELSKIS
jgi:hypothetical protein